MTNDTKSLVEQFFKRLWTEIDSQDFDSESKLEGWLNPMSEEEKRWVTAKGGTPPPDVNSLFGALGYQRRDVDDHPSKSLTVGRMTFIPDYILSRNKTELLIVELKGPGEKLDNGKYVAQVLSYCRELQIPLGLLFNGIEVRVFVNTGLKRLARFANEVDLQPVATASRSQPRRMFEVLAAFSAGDLDAGSINLAVRLASARVRELIAEKRRKKIQADLRSLLSNPTGELLKTMAGNPALWSEDLGTPPSPRELQSAWDEIQKPDAPRPPVGSINAVMRQKVAEVCSRHGTDALKGVRGLRTRDREGNGYHLVPQGPGVPGDLYVQGVATGDAKQIIEQLDKFLHSSTS